MTQAHPLNLEAMHQKPLLVIDFGSQYSQLITRRVRELGVYAELLPYDCDPDKILALSPQGIIVSGGPETVTEKQAPSIPSVVFELGCPVLGICYGMQAMAAQLGGRVQSGDSREFGYVKLTIEVPSLLFHDDPDPALFSTHTTDVWMSHGDQVIELPPGFITLADTSTVPIAAMADESRHYYGVQFHPEVTQTVDGLAMIKRFVRDVCGCEPLWLSDNIIETTVQKIRDQVGEESVILGLSGGVDSAVTAALLHQAIGDQLVCVFVDTGLLRLGEAEEVMRVFSKQGIRLIRANEAPRFLKALAGVTDPEAKRKIIGREFIAVFEHIAQTLPEVKWLAQGTIYPDVIESAGTVSGKAHVIKSHHNVGGLPERLKLKLLEPLRELFKDEVRKLGLDLGLPHAMLYRHPFPGPGLAVRILGEVKQNYIDLLQQADAIFIEALVKENLYDKVSQAFVVFLPVRSVSVLGDARHYGHVVSLRAVETTDFMTARWARLPHEFLAEVGRRIINEVKGISRVTYDISSKPPATIEWE